MTATTTAPITAADIAFGIEIECMLRDEHVHPMTAKYRRGGHGTSQGAQVDFAPAGWVAQSDGSLNPGGLIGYTGVEISSPKLIGLDGLTQVVLMVDDLYEHEVKFNRTCGMHVHLDARGMTDAQREHFVDMFMSYERAVFGLNGASVGVRWNNTYCEPINGIRSRVRMGSDNFSDRYRSLNTINVYKRTKCTMEVRCLMPTDDPDEIVAIITMLTTMMAAARNMRPIGGDSPVPTENMANFIATYLGDDSISLVQGDERDEVAAVLMELAEKADPFFAVI